MPLDRHNRFAARLLLLLHSAPCSRCSNSLRAFASPRLHRPIFCSNAVLRVKEMAVDWAVGKNDRLEMFSVARLIGFLRDAPLKTSDFPVMR